ncbi:hypothetical protein [Synechococcus sp. M16CYN]
MFRAEAEARTAIPDFGCGGTQGAYRMSDIWMVCRRHDVTHGQER